MGARIFVLGEETTTNDGGVFFVNDVPVVNAVGADGSIQQTLPVSVVAGAGYLNAVVTVRPQAQFDGTPDFDPECATADGGDSSADGGGVFGDGDGDGGDGGFAGNGGSGAADCSDLTRNRTNPQTVFVDGFAASTGVVRVPALTASLEVVARDKVTGELVPGVEFECELDPDAFSDVDSSTQGGTNNDVGEVITLSGGAGSATSGAGASGGFAAGVGYTCVSYTHMATGINGTTGLGSASVFSGNMFVSFAEAVQPQLVCDVLVMERSSDDELKPFIVEVQDGITETAEVAGLDDTPVKTLGGSDGDTRLMLAEGVNQSFTVQLSETLDAARFDADEAVIVLDLGESPTDGAIIVPEYTAALAGDQITVDLATALPRGRKFDIVILDGYGFDAAGNPLCDDDGISSDRIEGVEGLRTLPTGGDEIEYDYTFTAAGDHPVDGILLALKTMTEINRNAGTPDVVQVKTDANGDGGNPNSSFVDLIASGDVNQLDAFTAGTTSGTGGPLLAEQQRKQDFLDALGDGRDVFTTQTLITITPNATEPAASHAIALAGRTFSVSALDATGAVVATASTATTSAVIPLTGALAPAATGTTYLVQSAVAPASYDGLYGTGAYTGTLWSDAGQIRPGDVITVTPFDGLGSAGVPATVTLEDCVPPTTILQRSYCQASTDSTAGATFGNGNELVDLVDETAGGLPVSHKTPELLDNEPNATLGNVPTDGTLNDELYENTGIDAGIIALETFSNGAASTVPTNAPATGGTRGVYDATAYAALNLSRTIGIDFSEPVALTGTPAYTGNANAFTLGSWTVRNGVQDEFDSAEFGDRREISDLAVFTVSDVFAFANDVGDDDRFDFTGVIEDLAGNEADAAARAIVLEEDDMPPFVVTAEEDGEFVRITFNETILRNGAGTDTVTIYCDTADVDTLIETYSATLTPGAGQDPVLIDGSASAASGTVVEIPVTNFSGGYAASRQACFASLAANYDEDAFYPNTDGEDRDHTMIGWDDVSDANGNTWDGWETDRFGADDDCVEEGSGDALNGVNTPLFAMIDALGPFVLTATDGTDIEEGEDMTLATQSASFTVNQPMFLCDAPMGADDTISTDDGCDGVDPNDGVGDAGVAFSGTGTDNDTEADVEAWLEANMLYNDLDAGVSCAINVTTNSIDFEDGDRTLEFSFVVADALCPGGTLIGNGDTLRLSGNEVRSQLNFSPADVELTVSQIIIREGVADDF